MQRALWQSRLGFIMAAAGSAIGLANIWRFPYIVGYYGGAAFIAVYLLFLLLIGLPVFTAEVLIGRKSHLNPLDAFEKLGKNPRWRSGGALILLTGLIVSCFYSVVAGWVFGYWVGEVSGSLQTLHSTSAAAGHFNRLIESPYWALCYHTLFIGCSGSILYFGVQKGLERGNKILLPMLFLMLLFVLIRALLLPNAWQGVRFLLQPDWSALTPLAIITALGHAFFTLSLGQGTMITYGSYLSGKESLIPALLSAVVMDTLVSLLAAISVFAIVFSAGLEPTSGPGLFFMTLPPIFAELPAGQWLGAAFFGLVLLAALTSQISAMEPSIAFLSDRYSWSRHRAVAAISSLAWLAGIPLALSTGLLSEWTIAGNTLLDSVAALASDCLIPLGGLLSVLLVGWRWGMKEAMEELFQGASNALAQNRWVQAYFYFCLKYCAPVLITLVFLNALGLFS